MFNFLRKKKRNLFSEELQLIICNRSIKILMSEYNFESETFPSPKFIENIIDMNASDDDVLKFADEYGCTVDYLLGRTDTPYYTL